MSCRAEWTPGNREAFPELIGKANVSFRWQEAAVG